MRREAIAFWYALGLGLGVLSVALGIHTGTVTAMAAGAAAIWFSVAGIASTLVEE